MKAICASVNFDLFMVLPRPTARIAHAAKLEFSSKDRSENREAGQLLHWHRQPRSIRARRWRRTPVRCRSGCEAPGTFGCWLSSYEKPSAGGRFVVPGSIDRPQELALRLMAASRH